MIKKTLKILQLIILMVVLLNITFWWLVEFNVPPLSKLYNNGLIIGIGDNAYVFAHGSYGYLGNISNCIDYYSLYNTQKCLKKNNTYAHRTRINNKIYLTKEIVEELKYKGYNTVWGSWCEQGNEEFIIRYPNGTKIMWYNYVDRVKSSGSVIPIFYVFGLWRVVL